MLFQIILHLFDKKNLLEKTPFSKLVSVALTNLGTALGPTLSNIQQENMITFS